MDNDTTVNCRLFTFDDNAGACLHEIELDAVDVEQRGEYEAAFDSYTDAHGQDAGFFMLECDAVDASVYILQQQQARTIHAEVKSEGSTYNVRLYDQHGIELPAFVFEARYDGVTMQHDTAISKAFAVRDYINSLAPSTRNALYLLQA